MQHKCLRTGFILCWFFLPAQQVLGRDAQPGSDDFEEVVVSATRIPTDITDLPFAVGRVGREEIQFARQQLGLDEALATIPGLFFQNRYNFAQDLRIAIRGFGARANFGIRGIPPHRPPRSSRSTGCLGSSQGPAHSAPGSLPPGGDESPAPRESPPAPPPHRPLRSSGSTGCSGSPTGPARSAPGSLPPGGDESPPPRERPPTPPPHPLSRSNDLRDYLVRWITPPRNAPDFPPPSADILRPHPGLQHVRRGHRLYHLDGWQDCLSSKPNSTQTP